VPEISCRSEEFPSASPGNLRLAGDLNNHSGGVAMTMSRRKRGTRDPGVLGGQPVIKSTRLAVETFVVLTAVGWSEPQIIENSPAANNATAGRKLMKRWCTTTHRSRRRGSQDCAGWGNELLPAKPIARAWLFAAALVTAVPMHAAANEPKPQQLFNEAVQLFFDAKPVESARLFDQLVAALPAAEPGLWQRGLAMYYADRFADGRAQFELHRTVNPNDVENPAWHFLCVAKLEGVEAARDKLLPVGEDPRVPMKEILALFSGRGDEAAVLQAAEQGEGEARKNQICSAHLYLGLFHEAAGDAEKARQHITQAAGPFRMDHFMGRVAVMHAKLRGWAVEERGPGPVVERPGP